MPRPLYIVCCKTGSEDKETGLMSLYHVLEKINIVKLPEIVVAKSEVEDATPPGTLEVRFGTMPLRLVAVWMKSQDDPIEQEYEYETAFYFPPANKKQIVQNGTFIFNKDKWLRRFVVVASQIPPITGSGMLIAESRIRRAGSQDAWLRQDYPIVIEVIDQEAKEEK